MCLRIKHTLAWILAPQLFEGGLRREQFLAPLEHQPRRNQGAFIFHRGDFGAVEHMIPYVQLRDAPRERFVLLKRVPECVLLLPDNEKAIGADAAGAVQAATP